MKRLIVFSALLALTSCSLLESRDRRAPQARLIEKDVPSQARDTESPRKRVVVLPFLDASTPKRSARVTEVARETLVRALARTGEFVVINNNEFQKDLTQFTKNGEYDLEALSKIASQMGLAAILEGKILEVRARRLGDEVGIVREIKARLDATVGLRMASTKNGKIIFEETRSAQLEDSTTRIGERSASDKDIAEDPKLVEAVVIKAVSGTIGRIAQAIDKLNWEGRVALVKGDRIFLNAGRISGLQIGDVLKVTEEGEDVFDPETGSLIGRVPGRLKGTIEIVSYFGKDGAVAITHSGSGFRENDLVELY